MEGYRVAVVGALGAVGTEMIKTLEQRNFPVSALIPMDVESMAGKKVVFKGVEVKVRAAKSGAFGDVDIALFSAGAEASEILAPAAASEGAIVIDNSSQWRMDPSIPLVIPEVNPEDLDWHKGIIANPQLFDDPDARGRQTDTRRVQDQTHRRRHLPGSVGHGRTGHSRTRLAGRPIRPQRADRGFRLSAAGYFSTPFPISMSSSTTATPRKR